MPGNSKRGGTKYTHAAQIGQFVTITELTGLEINQHSGGDMISQQFLGYKNLRYIYSICILWIVQKPVIADTCYLRLTGMVDAI